MSTYYLILAVCEVLTNCYLLLLKHLLTLAEVKSRNSAKRYLFQIGNLFSEFRVELPKWISFEKFCRRYSIRKSNSENQLPIWKRFLFAKFRHPTSANLRNGFTTCYYLLLTTCCVPLVPCSLLIVSYYLMLTAYYLTHTTHHSRLTTTYYSLLLISYYLLLTTFGAHYLAKQVARVRIWISRTAHCSFCTLSLLRLS